MLRRIGYSLKQAWCYRRLLKQQYRLEQCWLAKRLIAVDCAELKQRGIAAIILDFDGVMNAHGQREPLPIVKEWLQQALTVFPAKRIFILSNKPSPIRAQFFKAHFPGIDFIAGVRKKPYPDGLEQIIAQTQLTPEQHVLVDDRLLTGVLAAKIAGTQAIWITKPYRCCAKKPLVEGFFCLLRCLERIWLRL